MTNTCATIIKHVSLVQCMWNWYHKFLHSTSTKKIIQYTCVLYTIYWIDLGSGGSKGQATYTIYYIQYTELILGGGRSEG